MYLIQLNPLNYSVFACFGELDSMVSLSLPAVIKSAARRQRCAWLLLASFQLHCTATLTCDQTLQRPSPWHTRRHSSIKPFKLWPHCTAHRLILKMETVTVSGCKCSDDLCVCCFLWGWAGVGVASLLTTQITYYLMWFSQAGRLLFSTSFVFSVEVHLINVGLCQGPAHRLAGSP